MNAVTLSLSYKRHSAVRAVLRQLILVTCSASAAAAACEENPLLIVRDVQIAGGALPVDIRWAGDDDDVYVSFGPRGIVRTSIGSVDNGTTVVPSAGKGGFAFPSHIAVGRDHLIVAAPFGGIAAIELGATGKQHQAPNEYAAIVDIDARGDKVALLGAERGDVQGLSSDGVIAWIGSISKNMTDLRPLMRGRSTPGGKDVARCGFLENGGIRLMVDGTVVLFSGVEQGVYRYDAQGKLVQTWTTDAFGLLDDCGIGDDELALLGRDYGRRTRWLASRVTLDDILPLADGAALLLRHVVGDVTKWQMVILPFKGKPREVTVPIEMASPRAHFRGDVRGNRIVLWGQTIRRPAKSPTSPRE